MANVFVSYTSSDRDWAFWIGQELEKLGHTPRICEWELSGGSDIAAWMEERHHNADQVLCVISKTYLTKPFSIWERRAAEWAAATDRPGFALPVLIEPCEVPTLLAPVKRCDLYDVDEDEARTRLKDFLTPVGKPSTPTRFPGSKPKNANTAKPVSFPGTRRASSTLSNIPIAIPIHFLGRGEDLAALDAMLAPVKARAALHGMRGVGKTTLAAAYAERHRDKYRATWWISAETPEGMRADLVALGVRLGWVAADEKEEPALATLMERLRDEGDGILLIYDHAIDVVALKPYLPLGGQARVLLTSNAHAWRGIALPIEIKSWPKEIGTEYLIARTGHKHQREAALALSVALGGLPLAHEQAAAYCERLEVPLSEYRRRFEDTPARILDSGRDAPVDYRLTVAKTFALAIDEASKLHPGAAPLIIHAALLAPEPVPLFLFAETREKFDEPLASALASDGLDEAVAALRAFALVDRETIADERDPAIATDCIRLHRLVRAVAAERCDGREREAVRRALIKAMAAAYPREVHDDPKKWRRARRLNGLASAFVTADASPAAGAEAPFAELLNGLGEYHYVAHAAYTQTRQLFERALAIRETALGREDPKTAESLNNLAIVLEGLGLLAEARPLFERALEIRQKVLGPESPDTANSLNNLAHLQQAQGDLSGARPLFERALAIRQNVLGAKHPYTATSLNNLGHLLRAQGDFPGAQPLFERALAVDENVLGSEHPHTSSDLNNLALVLQDQGDLVAARPLFERALAINNKVLGPEHPRTTMVRGNLARVMLASGDASGALALAQAALPPVEKMVAQSEPWIKKLASAAADALDELDRAVDAETLRKRYGLGD